MIRFVFYFTYRSLRDKLSLRTFEGDVWVELCSDTFRPDRERA